MALKKSGIQLVAEGYALYIKQLRDINKTHKEAFKQDPSKAYEEAANKMGTSSKKVSQGVKTVTTSLKESWVELQKFRAGLDQVGTSANPIGALAARMKASGREVKQSVQETQSLIDTLRKTTSQMPTGVGGGTGGGLLSFLTGLPGKFAEAKAGALGFAGGLIKAAGPITALVAGMKTLSDIMNFFKTATDVAQSNETMAVSLQEVGTAVGYTNDQIELAVELLKQQGITTSVSQKSLMRMARANISWAEASKLAAIAQGSAVTAGINSSEAFERLVTGIQKMEPELLDELGITLQREKAYEKFGATIGKNARSLTQAEKQQAILNSVYEQSEVVLGVYDAAMETTGKQAGSLARHIEETQLSVGKALLPFKSISVTMQTDFWKGARQAAKGLESFGALFSGVIKGLGDMTYYMTQTVEESAAFGKIVDQLQELGLSQLEATNTTKGLIEELEKTGEVNFKDVRQQLLDLGVPMDEAAAKARLITDSLNKMGEDLELGDNISQETKEANLAIKEMLDNVMIGSTSLGEILEFLGLRIDEETGKMSVSWDNIGRKFHEYAKDTAIIAGRVVAVFKVMFDQIRKNVANNIALLEDIKNLNLESAMKRAFDPEIITGFFDQKAYETAFSELDSYVQDNFPDLFKPWEEVTKKVEGTSEDLRNSIQNAVPEEVDTKEQEEALEALADAYKRLDDIFRKYDQDYAKMVDDYHQGLQKLSEEAAVAETKLAENRDKQLAKIDQDYAKQRSKLIQDSQKEEKERQKKHHRDMEYELKRFQLSQTQAQRRFQLSDRRLRAEGDILALMELRENYDLEQKEAKENFDLDRQQKEEQAAEEDRARQEELQTRLEELQQNIEDQRDQVNASYEEELAALQIANAEKEEEFKRSMEERFNQLVENRNREIEELGRSLSEEKKITEEGMGEIAGAIAAIFDSDAAADALIKGWTERTTSAFGSMVEDIEKELEELQGAIEEASSMPTTDSASSLGFSSGRTGGRGGQRGRPVGMRHGGEGVVTGPAHFFVEPGVKEHVKFTPLNQGTSMRHTGSMGLNLNVSGLQSGMNEKLEQAIIERAADLTIDNIEIAIERIKRRS